jgi:3'-phosphoadenosine 5'-phosphosulfate sulfotransferase (PAPS reductase)/FAD synthetase
MNIFNLSFGKDSMATLILAAEQGIPIDRVMYCDIRFNNEISGEHPLMAEWIPTAERILKERFGITVEHTFGKTYLEAFYTVKKTGRFSGKIYGFPYIRGAWCNHILKLNAISKYLSQFKKQTITQFVGIACDEPRRWERMKAKENSRKKYRSLLVEQNLTEQDAFRICKKYGLLSPLYKSNDSIFRGGCWFCPKQCSADLYSLWKNYPDYYQKLVDIENDSRIINKFKPDGNPSDYAKRFEAGYVPKRRKKQQTSEQLDMFKDFK